MIRRLLPLVLFVAIAIFLGVGLTLNPTIVPSPLVGKPAPDFTLPRLKAPQEMISKSDLLGKVSLLNVWATWCVSCRAEHPILVELSKSSGVPIYGLNYKDKRDDAIRWLQQLGDPYVANAFDADGRVGIDLGVYGAPETFVLNAEGQIVYKHIGPITTDSWRDKILPVLGELSGVKG